jgi:hypothetical protein
MKILFLIVVCIGLGVFGFALSFSKLMYNGENSTDGLYLAVLFLLAASIITGYGAHLFPSHWFVGPLIIGAPALLFTLYNWFIVENTKGFLLWKVISLSFFVVPAITAYAARMMK